MLIHVTNTKKGFTLVELLIAISLIAILSGVLFAVINPIGIQKKARDSQRVSDLAKIKTALENYFSDNRAYPNFAGWVDATSLPLATTYINKIPEDPKKTGSLCGGTEWRRYAYKSVAGGTAYLLTTNMETVAMGGACPATPAAVAALCNNCTFTNGTAYYTTTD